MQAPAWCSRECGPADPAAPEYVEFRENIRRPLGPRRVRLEAGRTSGA